MRYLLISILLITVTACTNSDSKSDQKASDTNDKISATVTTTLLADLVNNIAGNLVSLQTIVGPGVDPHLYKATQKDLQKLQNADVIFHHGLYFEGKMEEILEKLSRSKPVFATASEIDKSRLITVSEENNRTLYDPHIWFDASLWASTIPYIARKLSEVDTKNQNVYIQNGRAYGQQLLQLHQSVKKQVETIAKGNRYLITTHDAFSYFSKAYDIEVKSLQGVSTVAEFGLKDISDLTNFIVQNKVKSIFSEAAVSPKATEAVIQGCKEKNWVVKNGGALFADGLGAQGTAQSSYEGMINFNLQAIVNGLK